jgi:Sulfotransferase domain
MPSAHKPIVWIASYPKSGNTWIRFLVCNLIFGPQDSAAALNHLAADLHELRELPQPLPARLLLKTHFQFSDQMPLAAESARAIYIVRHPADTMLSNFYYCRRSGAGDADDRGALDRYVDHFLQARGDSRWAKLGMGTWESNVNSWIGSPRPFPVLPLRYEDLLADPIAAANRVREFLRLDCSDQEVARAIAASSFERLRAIEEADISSARVGIFYKPYLQPSIRSGLRFMRAGQGGEAQRTLTADQLRRVDSTFEAAMRVCGYPVSEAREITQGAQA